MKLFYEIFILAALSFYSTLSFSLLGSWAFEKARSLRVAHPLKSPGRGKTRAR